MAVAVLGQKNVKSNFCDGSWLKSYFCHILRKPEGSNKFWQQH